VTFLVSLTDDLCRRSGSDQPPIGASGCLSETAGGRTRAHRCRPLASGLVGRVLYLLAVLDQNPGADWRAITGQIDLAPESNPDLEPLPDDAGRPLAPITVLRLAR
jgi:hypothetical protein